MKVSIPVKKTITETVELPQLPYYSCRFGSIYYMITEAQVVVQVNKRQIVYWEPNETYYGEHLLDAYQADKCTKEDFDIVLVSTRENINSVLNPASGQSGVNHMQDPNLQQPANQEANAEQVAATNDAVQATEQQAQEEAMESEGSTEG